MFTHDHVRSCLFGLIICFMIGLFWRPDIGKHGGLSWRKRLGNHLEIRTTGRLFRRPDDCSSGRTTVPAAGWLSRRPKKTVPPHIKRRFRFRLQVGNIFYAFIRLLVSLENFLSQVQALSLHNVPPVSSISSKPF